MHAVKVKVDSDFSEYSYNTHTGKATNRGDVFSGAGCGNNKSFKKRECKNTKRQEFFEEKILKIAKEKQIQRIPIHIQFNDQEKRMDWGCVGFAIGRGFFKKPSKPEEIEYVELTDEFAKEIQAEIDEAVVYPDDLPQNEDEEPSYPEGAKKQVTVNAYERNPRARRLCIAHYGCSCAVCGFDFQKAYGSLGKGFIHVHHIVPLGEIRQEYDVDPIKDLRPVCPNCHAMLHKKRPALTIEELKENLK